jgi:hypothetical protein
MKGALCFSRAERFIFGRGENFNLSAKKNLSVYSPLKMEAAFFFTIKSQGYIHMTTV